MKINDVILRSVSKGAVFIILAFSIYLFFAGHSSPGGGFIGGVVTASALVLLYLTFDAKTVSEILPVNYIKLTASGLLIAVLTGLGSLLYGNPFLSHAFDYYSLPLLGEVELATAVLFDLGVYLTVVGVTMTIILSIGEDD